jgi:hypothetical protein
MPHLFNSEAAVVDLMALFRILRKNQGVFRKMRKPDKRKEACPLFCFFFFAKMRKPGIGNELRPSMKPLLSSPSGFFLSCFLPARTLHGSYL